MYAYTHMMLVSPPRPPVCWSAYGWQSNKKITQPWPMKNDVNKHGKTFTDTRLHLESPQLSLKREQSLWHTFTLSKEKNKTHDNSLRSPPNNRSPCLKCVWGGGGVSTAQGQRDIVVVWAMTQCTIWSLHGGNMLCLCSYAPLKCIFYLDFNLLLPNLDIDFSYKNKSPVHFLNSQQEGDYDHLPNCLKTPLKTLNIV